MSDARAALLWVLELAHDNHPDSHGRIADAFLERFDIAPAKKTPEEWSRLKGIVIVDPDGWRRDGDPPLDEPIAEEEFDRRASESTIAHRKADGSW